MKVLIPENAVLWTPNGLCFGSELQYGMEIFTIDAKNRLVATPITHDVEEPDRLRVRTMLSKNSITTLVPNYKVYRDKKLVPAEELKKKDTLALAGAKLVKEFRNFHDEHSQELMDGSPYSAIGAYYLGLSGLKPNKQAAYFETPDEKTMNEFAEKLRDDTGEEFESDVSCTRGLSRDFGISNKQVKYLVLLRSDKFFKIRSSIDLNDDKIHNSIYTNGLNIYAGFLRSLFRGGLVHHLNYHTRGIDGDRYTILNMPWRGKTRKLLQNSSHVLKSYRLTMYASRPQMNSDELKLEKYDDASSQSVLEIRDHLADCHTVEIPLGHKIVTDNLVVKPFELTDDMIEELQSYEEKPELDIASLRRKIAGSATGQPDIPKRINEIAGSQKLYHLHVVGIIKAAGKVRKMKTKYGTESVVSVVLYDETGEIKARLWGDIALEVREGAVLEIAGGYLKNGIINNSKKGHEEIHGVL